MDDLTSKGVALLDSLRFVVGIADRLQEALGLLAGPSALSEANRPRWQQDVLDGANLLPKAIAQARRAAADSPVSVDVLAALDSFAEPLERLRVTIGANTVGVPGDSLIDLALSFARSNERLMSCRDALFQNAEIQKTLAGRGSQFLDRHVASNSPALANVATDGAEPVAKERTDVEPPPTTGASEHGEGTGNEKRKRHRRQRGRQRGNYDEALHQKIFAAYGTIKDYDVVASRYGVSADDARLIVKRHRSRERRKHERQSRPKRKAK
jgi:hypothetical protein